VACHVHRGEEDVAEFVPARIVTQLLDLVVEVAEAPARSG
jgi:hypothetical protein